VCHNGPNKTQEGPWIELFNAVVGSPYGNANEDNLRYLHQQPEARIADSPGSSLAILSLGLA
jgi:hypothetical protein